MSVFVATTNIYGQDNRFTAKPGVIIPLYLSEFEADPENTWLGDEIGPAFGVNLSWDNYSIANNYLNAKNLSLNVSLGFQLYRISSDLFPNDNRGARIFSFTAPLTVGAHYRFKKKDEQKVIPKIGASLGLLNHIRLLSPDENTILYIDGESYCSSCANKSYMEFNMGFMATFDFEVDFILNDKLGASLGLRSGIASDRGNMMLLFNPTIGVYKGF